MPVITPRPGWGFDHAELARTAVSDSYDCHTYGCTVPTSRICTCLHSHDGKNMVHSGGEELRCPPVSGLPGCSPHLSDRLRKYAQLSTDPVGAPGRRKTRRLLAFQSHRDPVTYQECCICDRDFQRLRVHAEAWIFNCRCSTLRLGETTICYRSEDQLSLRSSKLT